MKKTALMALEIINGCDYDVWCLVEIADSGLAVHQYTERHLRSQVCVSVCVCVCVEACSGV